jgi:hypothetical protein
MGVEIPIIEYRNNVNKKQKAKEKKTNENPKTFN